MQFLCALHLFINKILMKKRIVSILIIMCSSVAAFSQSGTNSPYSQYGLGVLSDQTSGFNRGMNGVGIGFREGNQVNFINPASYSGVDSLTFIFDAGISGQITNFNENGHKKNANNADFEYAVAALRLFKHLGLSFGIVPFTNVGYNYSSSQSINEDNSVSYQNTYTGSGGLHQVYVGLGYQLFKGFSIGVNGSYLWGDITRNVQNAYSSSYVNTLSKSYYADVRSYNVTVGAQYSLNVSKKDNITLGITFTPGHKLGADAECLVSSTNTQTSVVNTDSLYVRNGLEIPNMYGAGLTWSHNNRIKVGFDYTLQKWSSVEYPQYAVVNDKPVYALQSGLFADRQKFNLGAEFCANPDARNFFNRIRYRLGGSYATSYLKINGKNGPKELSLSAGFGIPIFNSWNNRSILNISGQWVRQAAKGMITENTFRINIGLTFNERWFQKWKVE